MFHLKPSEIRYSQDSINNFFDAKSNHSHRMIGETLDDICENRCSLHDIPTIRVLLHSGEWTTSDNRRLWVFRHLERLGKCNEIPVIESYYIPDTKLTSQNDGLSVRVRGNPGGFWHKRPRKASPVLHSQRRTQSQTWLTTARSGYGHDVNRSYLNTVRSHTTHSVGPQIAHDYSRSQIGHDYGRSQIGHDYGRSQMGYSYDRSPVGYNQGFASSNSYSSGIRRSTAEESLTFHGRSSYRVSDGHSSGTRRSEYRPPVQSVKSNDSWCTIL